MRILERVIWGTVVVAGAFLVGLLLLAFVVSVTRPTYPPDFEAQIPAGGEVIYVEDRGAYGATRIVDVDGCAIVQGWNERAARWELTTSRGGAFGGTRNIANVDCGAAP